jgi:hypothetical protein
LTEGGIGSNKRGRTDTAAVVEPEPDSVAMRLVAHKSQPGETDRHHAPHEVRAQ